ncbi:alpha/beta hydrolase-fold protein [Methylocystis sp. 9N]|uniref:Alpha/beta hydrolase-fold protein n=1 Tax=Methylocystis borbori TaxID=3118750 RepID=A0ABU7XFI0_9HYPH
MNFRYGWFAVGQLLDQFSEKLAAAGKSMEVVIRLRSSHLENERPIWIREPRNIANASNLVVFLDGELYRDHVDVSTVIEDLQGEIADAWFVFVSAGSPEARRLECPCYPPFSRFIAEELLPYLENTHIDFNQVRRRTLAGLSYTGLAAASVAKDFPAAFQRVISQSGSFWWNDCWLVEEFRRLNSRIPVEFYLDVGSREIYENVDHGYVLQVVSQIEGVRRFRDVLANLGHSVMYQEFEGDHDYKCWNKTLSDALRWCLPPEPKAINSN